MNKKIINKKGFWSGMSFLLLAFINIPLLINVHNDMNITLIIKRILIITFCILLGATQVYRGINSKCAKEDKQNDDERERLVSLKAESSAFKITFNFCIVLTILLAIAIGVTKYDGLVGIFVGVAIMPTIMIISVIGAYFYHNKRNWLFVMINGMT